MRSIFLLIIVISTSAALKCYLGSVWPHQNDAKEQKCHKTVNHCALDVDSKAHGRLYLRCGDSDEVCDEGCTKGAIVPDNLKCCCKSDLCNDEQLVNRFSIKKAPKIEKGGTCLVGYVGLRSNAKRQVNEERCPTTLCMRKLVRAPRPHVELECGDSEKCEDLMECNNSLSTDCCCVGKNCNWKSSKTKSVPKPHKPELPSGDDEDEPSIPMIPIDPSSIPEIPILPIDSSRLAPKSWQFEGFMKYFQNPKELQGLIYSFYMWILEIGKTIFTSLGIGEKSSK